jgi:hypothetical protein
MIDQPRSDQIGERTPDRFEERYVPVIASADDRAAAQVGNGAPYVVGIDCSRLDRLDQVAGFMKRVERVDIEGLPWR